MPSVRTTPAEEHPLLRLGGAKDLPAPRRHPHEVARRLHHSQHLRRFDDGDRVAEVVRGDGVELEEVLLAAVVAQDLEKAQDLARPGVRDGPEGSHGRPGTGCRGLLLGQVDAGDDVVDLLHHPEKFRVPVLAGMRQRVDDLLLDRSGVRAEDDDAVAEIHRLVDQVRDHQDGRQRARAVRPEPVDLGPQQLRREDVERRERLVHAEELRAADERPGDPHALLHPARKLLREGPLDSPEPHALDRRLDEGVLLGLGQRPAVQPDAHVLLDRQPREEREVLEHHGGARVDAGERLPVDLHGARRRRHEPDEDPQKRRFAAARRAEHRHGLALADREIDVVQDDVLVARFVTIRLVDAGSLRRSARRRRTRGAERSCFGHRVVQRFREYFVSASR